MSTVPALSLAIGERLNGPQALANKIEGIVNLSKSELVDRVTPASKPLKGRDPPQAKTRAEQVKPVTLTRPSQEQFAAAERQCAA
jgi:hypothetical protein